MNTYFLARLRIFTHWGDQRVLGRGHGNRVMYQYDKYKSFIGFLSYEFDDKTYAFGSYDDYCTDIELRDQLDMARESEQNAWETEGSTVEDQEAIDMQVQEGQIDSEIDEPSSDDRIMVDQPVGGAVEISTPTDVVGVSDVETELVSGKTQTVMEDSDVV